MALDSLYYCNERLKESITISLQEGIVPILVQILQEGPEREKEVRVPRENGNSEEGGEGEGEGEGDEEGEVKIIKEGNLPKVLERACSVLTVIWFEFTLIIYLLIKLIIIVIYV